jgi:DNA mismatch repair protein MutS2
MAKAGLFLPTSYDSEIAFFDKILADIGDEQSIEQNLSTFSGHLSNISKILKNADDKSLVLIDENRNRNRSFRRSGNWSSGN